MSSNRKATPGSRPAQGHARGSAVEYRALCAACAAHVRLETDFSVSGALFESPVASTLTLGEHVDRGIPTRCCVPDLVVALTREAVSHVMMRRDAAWMFNRAVFE